VAVLKRPFFLRLAPKDFVVSIRVERRVDVDQIDATVRQLAKLIEIVAAIDNLRINQRYSANPACASSDLLPLQRTAGRSDV
jgi:hypothetical protein